MNPNPTVWALLFFGVVNLALGAYKADAYLMGSSLALWATALAIQIRDRRRFHRRIALLESSQQ